MGWLNDKICLTWYLWDIWEILEEELQGLHFSIKYQFREGNQVADFLAQQGGRGKMLKKIVGERTCQAN